MKLYKFISNTCGPCKLQNEEFDNYPIEVPVKTINIDEEDSELIIKYNVSSVPKMVLVDNKGKTVHQWIGYTQSWIINDFIKAYKK